MSIGQRNAGTVTRYWKKNIYKHRGTVGVAAGLLKIALVVICGTVTLKSPVSHAESTFDMRVITEEALAIVTIMQEAAGEPYAGKLAVAEVIRNRMQKKYASDGTVSGTVLRPLQFSGWNAKDPGRVRSVRIDTDDRIVQDCVKAWQEAQAGSDTVKGSVLYYNPSIIQETPEWALPDSAIPVAVVGQHHFFIPKPRRGSTPV